MQGHVSQAWAWGSDGGPVKSGGTALRGASACVRACARVCECVLTWRHLHTLPCVTPPAVYITG